MTRPIAPDLAECIGALRKHILQVLSLSLIIGILGLASAGYMLEVYDRVLNSRSTSTLVMLTVLVLFIYVIAEGLEWVRSTLLQRLAQEVDDQLRVRLFDAVFEARTRRLPNIGIQTLAELRTLGESLQSRAITALLDAPAALIFLALVFLIHPAMGVASLIGAIVQVALAVLNEKTTHPPLQEANRAFLVAQQYAQSNLQNAPVIEAMGMQESILQRWLKKQREFLALQALASDRAGAHTAGSKLVQTIQGSFILGLGCWLTIKGSFLGGGGLIIVASILGGRLLAPLVQLITNWKQVDSGRRAWHAINNLLLAIPKPAKTLPLPRPQGHLQVEGVSALAPGSQVTVLKQLNFAHPAGQCLAIAGPSGAGKSTLAKLLVGAWPASAGRVRLDGADVFLWDKTELGPNIGYVPQEIELFDGTLADNIARFGKADLHAVREAASLVGLDRTIEALEKGYETRIGDEGFMLSAGQRQRVALARAFYQAPRLLVLDEPNANLDDEGDRCLLDTLKRFKAQGTTIILVTHRTSLLPVIDRLLCLREGQIQMHGPRDVVLEELRKQSTKPQGAPTIDPTQRPASA